MGMLMDMMAKIGGHLLELEVIEYALDGLEGESRTRAEEHLRSCGMCRKAVHRVMDMQDGLALMAAPAQAPEGLANRVVRGVLARRRSDGRDQGLRP